MKLMLTKKQAGKLAQCLATMKQIKKAKSSFQNDRELLDLFTEVDDSLKETISGLDTVEYKMVMILYGRFLASDPEKKRLNGKKRQALHGDL
jgi:hypothetical protein